MKHITIDVTTPDINIYPVCDVQLGAHGADAEGFAGYIEDARRDKASRLLGVGDYTDGISPSNRKNLLAGFVKGEIYDTTVEMLDAASEAQVAQFNEIVKGTKGRWDAVLSGHHWTYKTISENGTMVLRPSDADIADYVGAPYVEAGSDVMLTYRFPSAKKGKKRPIVRVWARHGEGSGQSYAAPLNQLEKQMRAFNADVFITAHHHKLVAARAVKLSEAPGHDTNLQATDALLVAGGSWMRSYMPDEVTYAEAGMMVPLATGGVVIRIKRKDDNTFRIRAEI